ncbi:MAG: transcription elongation factor GreB [Pseudomonadales bacterium]|nr:transcription elongation factor GreB [Pseudomonadales bacterium]
MGRYRAPAPPKAPYITPEGFECLITEEQQIWPRRNIVTAALSAAAAEGDRSENAEYIYRKKELASIDYRIRYLQRRIPKLIVVRQLPDNKQQVFFGAWVTLEDEEEQQLEYRIVGPDELDLHKQYISVDSPLAKALLKKHLDDEVEVTTPAGKRYFDIVGVWYETPATATAQ